MTVKLIVFLFLLIWSSIVYSENRPKEIQFNSEFKWERFELADMKTKVDFLSNSKEFNDLIENGLYTRESLLNDLHVIDLNGDGQNDIVFDGLSGGEPHRIAIYINERATFLKVFEDYQKILKIEFQSDKLNKIWIENRGCCGDPMVQLKTYKVSYDNSVPKFEEIVQSRYFNDCSAIRPKEKFEDVIKFEVTNDNYNIRFSPEINNENEYCWDQITGNILGSLTKGQKGFALGEFIDETGRTWWFSAFPPDTNIENSFYYNHGISKDWALGWISSRYVRIVTE